MKKDYDASQMLHFRGNMMKLIAILAAVSMTFSVAAKTFIFKSVSGQINNTTELKGGDLALNLSFYERKPFNRFFTKAGYYLKKIDKAERKIRVNKDGEYQLPEVKVRYDSRNQLLASIEVVHKSQKIDNSHRYYEDGDLSLGILLSNSDQDMINKHFTSISVDRFDLGFQDVAKIVTPDGESLEDYINSVLERRAAGVDYDCWEIDSSASYIRNAYSEDVENSVYFGVKGRKRVCRSDRFAGSAILSASDDLSGSSLKLESDTHYVASINRNWRFDMVANISLSLRIYSGTESVGSFNILTNRDMNELYGNCEYVGRFQNIKCKLDPEMTEIKMIPALDIKDYYVISN